MHDESTRWTRRMVAGLTTVLAVVGIGALGSGAYLTQAVLADGEDSSTTSPATTTDGDDQTTTTESEDTTSGGSTTETEEDSSSGAGSATTDTGTTDSGVSSGTGSRPQSQTSGS